VWNSIPAETPEPLSATEVLSLLLVISVALTVFFWLRIQRPMGSLYSRAGWLFIVAMALELGGFITRIYCWNNTPAYNAFQLYEFLLMLMLIVTTESTLLIRP
jgi:hypothetical protein